MNVATSASFKRAFRKRIQESSEVTERFYTCAEWFMTDPFDPRLRTHKLSGELGELWSFSVTFDIRVIFYFMAKDKAVFIDIGSHDDVY